MQARETQEQELPLKPVSTAPAGPSPWKKVLQYATVASFLVLAVPMILDGAIIPPIAVYMVLGLIGLGLLKWKMRVGSIFLAVIGTLFFIMNLPFIIPALSVPASTVDFLTVSLTVVCLIAMVVAAVATFRRSPGLRARPFVTAMLVLAAIAIGTGVVGKAMYDSASAQAGDVRVTAANFEFTGGPIEAESGEISVFVENKDTALHTFTIDELGVNLEIPGGETGRVTFEAGPGTYEFICVPHSPDMSGTLEVAG